jgi:hypothetical protein
LSLGHFKTVFGFQKGEIFSEHIAGMYGYKAQSAVSEEMILHVLPAYSEGQK